MDDINACSFYTLTQNSGHCDIPVQNNSQGDTAIRIDNYQYYAHKDLLSAYSGYFSAFFSFNNNFEELRNYYVKLDGVSAEIFSFLLNYMYSSKLELTNDNIGEVLEAADYLQIQNVRNKCSEYLEVNLNNTNCLDILTIAERLALRKLRNTAYAHLCSNLSMIIECNAIDDFTQEIVENILKFDLAIDCTEADILLFVLRWFFSGTDNKFPHQTQYSSNIRPILQHIRYEEIPATKIEEILQIISNEFCTESCTIALYQDLIEYISSNKKINSEWTYSRFSSRGMALAYIRIGELGNLGIAYPDEINFCFLNQKYWKHLTRKVYYGIFYASAVLDNILYLVGGYVEGFGTCYTYKYDPRIDLWTEIEAMELDRRDFTLTACGSKVYAVGGITNNRSGYTKSCECFHPGKGIWETIEPLPDFMGNHAAATILIGGVPKLYVSGGLYKDYVRGSMYCFDPSNNSWHQCAPMITPRTNHYMHSYGSKIYVCGGFRDYPSGLWELYLSVSEQIDPDPRFATTIEEYDCLEDKWKIVTYVQNPRNLVGVIGHGSKLYIIRDSKECSKDMCVVDYYDLATNQWTYGLQDLQKFWEPSFTMLYVPKCRDPEYKNLWLERM